MQKFKKEYLLNSLIHCLTVNTPCNHCFSQEAEFIILAAVPQAAHTTTCFPFSPKVTTTLSYNSIDYFYLFLIFAMGSHSVHNLYFFT